MAKTYRVNYIELSALNHMFALLNKEEEPEYYEEVKELVRRELRPGSTVTWPTLKRIREIQADRNERTLKRAREIIEMFDR